MQLIFAISIFDLFSEFFFMLFLEFLGACFKVMLPLTAAIVLLMVLTKKLK